MLAIFATSDIPIEKTFVFYQRFSIRFWNPCHQDPDDSLYHPRHHHKT